MEERGIKYAIDYLSSFYPLMLVPDELHKRAGITCKVDTLSRKLRSNTNRAEPEKGRVLVVYDTDERGDKVAFYRGNPGFRFPSRKKVKREDTPGVNPKYAIPAVFFYAIEDSRSLELNYSPYYNNREDMDKKLAEVKAAAGTRLFKYPTYSGSHENPVRL